ncbi:MAG: hypothetical protein P4L22_00790 [Candidatus Babeliales bacterium]|nr:hypothetical protein [Candidatus Babeliales bacterium]
MKKLLIILASIIAICIVFIAAAMGYTYYLNKKRYVSAQEFNKLSTKLVSYGNTLKEYQTARIGKDFEFPKNLNIPEDKIAKLPEVRRENQEKFNQLIPEVKKIRKDLLFTPLNIRNEQGQTPLMLDLRIAPIVYALNKGRAKQLINAQDHNGKKVIQYLIESKYFNDIATYVAVLNFGARINNQDIEAAKLKLKDEIYLSPIINLLKIWQKRNN